MVWGFPTACPEAEPLSRLPAPSRQEKRRDRGKTARRKPAEPPLPEPELLRKLQEKQLIQRERPFRKQLRRNRQPVCQNQVFRLENMKILWQAPASSGACDSCETGRPVSCFGGRTAFSPTSAGCPGIPGKMRAAEGLSRPQSGMISAHTGYVLTVQIRAHQNTAAGSMVYFFSGFIK